MTAILLFVAFSFQTATLNSDTSGPSVERGSYSQDTGSSQVPLRLTEENKTISSEERAARQSDLALTKALVAATILTLFVLVYQSYWLKRSVTHAEASTRIDLRAYINPTDVSLKPNGVNIVLKNVGKTPAHDISVWRHIYHGPKGLWKLNWLDKHWSQEGLTLAPDGTVQHSWEVPALTPEDEAQIANGDPAIIGVHAIVRYQDVFGAAHETEYAYDIEVEKLQARRVNFTKGYNRAT